MLGDCFPLNGTLWFPVDGQQGTWMFNKDTLTERELGIGYTRVVVGKHLTFLLMVFSWLTSHHLTAKVNYC